MAAERVAVLLMAYGVPASLNEVEPYLRDVRGGRPTPPDFVQEIRQRYARIGGRAPIRGLPPAPGPAGPPPPGAGFRAFPGGRPLRPPHPAPLGPIPPAGAPPGPGRARS